MVNEWMTEMYDEHANTKKNKEFYQILKRSAQGIIIAARVSLSSRRHRWESGSWAGPGSRAITTSLLSSHSRPSSAEGAQTEKSSIHFLTAAADIKENIHFLVVHILHYELLDITLYLFLRFCIWQNSCVCTIADMSTKCVSVCQHGGGVLYIHTQIVFAWHKIGIHYMHCCFVDTPYVNRFIGTSSYFSRRSTRLLIALQEMRKFKTLWGFHIF